MTVDTFSIATDADDAGVTILGGGVWPPTQTFENHQGDTTMFATKSNSFGNVMENGLLRFDTSTIPADATITAANLLIYVVAVTDNASFSLIADYYDFGGGAGVVGDLADGSTTVVTATDLGAITTSAVNTIAVTDLTGIMRSGETNGQGNTGITGLRLMLSAGTPANVNAVEIAQMEHTTGQEPRLEVTYTAGAPQTLRPDADTTTTGWTTTPLWSKIEESVADGTVITATAS